jgi:pimeloyl-ACP methyl ester carboxylesterase
MSALGANASHVSLEARFLNTRSHRFCTPCYGGHMVWRMWGEGPTVALLHGGAGSWLHWIRTIPALATRWRVLAPDLPGLGESAMAQTPWTPGDSADYVVDGLNEILGSKEPIDLVGFSAGSMVAGLCAKRIAERCRTLVLVGASGLGFARASIILHKVLEKAGDERRAAHRINLANLMIADSRSIDEQALAIQEWNTMHARINSVGFAGTNVLSEALMDLGGRLKAIWGGEDAVARESLGERCAKLREIRPDVEIEIIPAAGHWVAYEAARAFNATLVAMLGDARPSQECA